MSYTMRRAHTGFVLLFCCALAAVLPGLHETCMAEVLLYTPDTSELGDEFVNALLVQESGALLVGTDRGVVEFDLQEGFEPVPFTPSSSVITAFASDSGTLWAGTYGNGLFRCGQAGFTQYRRREKGLVDDFITCLSFDQPLGELWVGTKRGLSRLKGDVFTSYTRLEGMPENHIRDVVAENNRVWVATDAGVARLTLAGQWEPFPAGQEIKWATALAVDEQGVWVGTRNGLYYVTGNGVRPFTPDNSGLPHRHVVDVIAREQKLWVSTLGGTAVFDGILWKRTDVAPGVATLPTGAMAIGAERVWVSVPGYGLAVSAGDEAALPFVRPRDHAERYGILERIRERERVLTKPWFRYGTIDGLPAEKITVLAPDEYSYDGKQVLWAGTAAGVARFDGMIFETYKDDVPLLYKWATTAIVMDQVTPGTRKHVWFGTRGGGLFAFDGESWIHFGILEGLPDNVILSLARDGRRLWVGTRKGLCLFDGNIWKTFNRESGLGGENIYAIQVTGSGVWVGTDIGVSVFDGRKFHNYTMWDGLPGLRIQAIGQFGEIFWLGALRGGLGTCKGDVFRSFPSANLLSGRAVQRFFSDGESLWMATSGGAFRYRSEAWLPVGTGDDQLTSGPVFDIFATPDVAWFATENGLVRHLLRR